jgi:hypothetical protein
MNLSFENKVALVTGAGSGDRETSKGEKTGFQRHQRSFGKGGYLHLRIPPLVCAADAD